MDIEFPYILGGDLVLTVKASVTYGCPATRVDPAEEDQMDIDEVNLPDGKPFETDDIYLLLNKKYISLMVSIEEEGWDYVAKHPNEDGPEDDEDLDHVL